MIRKKSYEFPYFWILAFAAFTFFLFLPAFKSYFFQDDWFSFSISQASTIQDFLNFFIPRSDVIYYRPLGMQIPFFLVRKLFGINPLPFKVATLLAHFLNGYIVYLLFIKLLNKRLLGLVASFLYLTSATHQIIFYWSATFAFILAPTFYFGSFLFFAKRRNLISFGLFCLGLLINELLITIPIILTLWSWFEERQIRIRHLIHYWFVLGIYLVARFVVFGLPEGGNYSFSLNLKQPVITLRNFTLWVFNWPEEIQAQFTRIFSLNRLFLQEFASSIAIFSALTTVFIVFFILIPLFIRVRTKRVHLNSRIILFGISWFIITSFPVLFLVSHAFTYYVPIPLFGVLLVGFGLFDAYSGLKYGLRYKVILLCVFSALWYYSALENMRLNQLIHWAPQRADKSRFLVSRFKEKYTHVSKGAIIIVTVGGYKEYRWALGDQNAFQALLNDQTILTYFGQTSYYFADRGIIDKEQQTQIEKTLYIIP